MKDSVPPIQCIVKLIVISSLFLFFSLIQTKSDTNSSTNKYVIGAHQGGFFAAFMAVLNHLAYCEKTHKTPVVYWNDRSWYYVKRGFNGSHNAWEYYFKPVSSLTYDPKKDRVYSSYEADTGQFHYTALDQVSRQKAHELIRKYVHIKSIVQKKIDHFYQQHMHGKHTIGIHLRGTDKFLEVKPVPLEKIIATALEHAQQGTQFLIASDEQQLLDHAIQLLQGHTVIFYNCYRSKTTQPLHLKNTQHEKMPSRAQLGEDVLVEVCLLSRCNLLVHTGSNVSAAAFYYNPNVQSIAVTHDN